MTTSKEKGDEWDKDNNSCKCYKTPLDNHDVYQRVQETLNYEHGNIVEE